VVGDVVDDVDRDGDVNLVALITDDRDVQPGKRWP
jgi:hypothetical protein